MTVIDQMLDRINLHNLQRLHRSCETDGDMELAALIKSRLEERVASDEEAESSDRS